MIFSLTICQLEVKQGGKKKEKANLLNAQISANGEVSIYKCMCSCACEYIQVSREKGMGVMRKGDRKWKKKRRRWSIAK